MLEEYNKLKDNNNDKIVFIKRGHFYYTYFKTIISISSDKKRRIRRNIKKKKYLYNKGYISYKSYYSSINSYNKNILDKSPNLCYNLSLGEKKYEKNKNNM